MDEKDNVGTFTAVKELFGKVLTKMLLNSGCYEHLPHFTTVFNTLEYKGVAFPVVTTPLRRLMMYNIETETTLGVEDVALNAQRRFFTSQL